MQAHIECKGVIFIFSKRHLCWVPNCENEKWEKGMTIMHDTIYLLIAP
jgi:hypothetical protein